MIKPTLGRVALAFSLLAAAGIAQADLLDNIKQAKKLRVAIELALPPYGMTNDKMQPYGSDVETAQLLAKDLGVELEIVPATGPTRIPFLQTNKADLAIATLSISPERQKVIDFSVPYSVVQIVVAAPKSMSIKGYGDLVGKTIAITRGNVQEMELVQKAVGAQIVRYDDDATLVATLEDGRWRPELDRSSAVILERLQQLLGSDVVNRFQLVSPAAPTARRRTRKSPFRRTS